MSASHVNGKTIFFIKIAVKDMQSDHVGIVMKNETAISPH